MQAFIDKLVADPKYLIYAGVAAGFILLAWIVLRIVFGRRIRSASGGRARQPRLGVVDAYDLDRQRQLVLVRRDNVEHLLMIGGPNDVLVESSIVRAGSEARPRPASAADDFAANLAPVMPPVSAPAALSISMAAPAVQAPLVQAGTPVPVPPPAPPIAARPAPPLPPLARPAPPPLAAPAAPAISPPQAAPAAIFVPVAPGARPAAPVAPDVAAAISEFFPESPAPAVAKPVGEPPPKPRFEFPRPPRPMPARQDTPVAPPPVPEMPLLKPVVEPSPPVIEAVKPLAEAPKPIAEAPKPAAHNAAAAVEPPKAADAAPKPAVAPKDIDPLEALEEEMAKLLGRPSSTGTPRR